MKKFHSWVISVVIIVSFAFVGGVSSTGENPSMAAAQTVRRTTRKAKRGGRWVVRKSWNGTRWVYRRVWVPTWRGTKKVGRGIKRAVT